MLERVLAGFARHPNVAAYLIVGLGCEGVYASHLVETQNLLQLGAAGSPAAGKAQQHRPPVLNIQDQGGISRTVDAAVEAVMQLMPVANTWRRTEQPASKLCVGLECGGSDGNSGIMWHVSEKFGASYESGPEYQILDSFAKTGFQAEVAKGNMAGAFYDIIPVKAEISKPAGEWNEGVIRIVGSKITLSINGKVTADVDSTTDEFKAMLAKSKFAKWDHFNKETTGHICFQDHGNPVSFRSIRIKEIK
jgi:hypothetical protein